MIPTMLIGAHVSAAGKVAAAVRRGAELGCEAIQIFNQSPRSWQPRTYAEEEAAEFREAFTASGMGACVIHAIYLLNPASAEPELRDKSLQALVGSLRAGDQIGAQAVILHPGSAKGEEPQEAIVRAGQTIAQALAESERCELHLENTAGAGGTLGRSIEELARLYEAAGSDRRLGICLDSCHLFASGFDIREPGVVEGVVADLEQAIGKGCVRSLHLNDSVFPLGSNKDRHANLGEGEIGTEGLANFLQARPLQGLPCILETPGAKKEGASAAEVALARRLRDGR